MSYKFYYDSMINSPNLTFRIIGVQSQKQDEDVATSSAAKVIIKDLIREPLAFSVTHNYSQNSGGVMSFWSNFKTWLSEAEQKYEEVKAKVDDFLKQFGTTEDGTLNAAAYRQSISWLDFFKTFNYSQVNIPLTFNVRLYPRTINGVLKDVKSQVKTINDYFLSNGGISDNKTTYTYYAPHGYSPATASGATRDIAGTLTLLYGRYAVIESLILTNYNVTFSKELIRTSPAKGSSVSPAYADVSITLEPSTVMTQDDIAAILASDYSSTVDKENAGWLVKDFTKYQDFYDNSNYI